MLPFSIELLRVIDGSTGRAKKLQPTERRPQWIRGSRTFRKKSRIVLALGPHSMFTVRAPVQFLAQYTDLPWALNGNLHLIAADACYRNFDIGTDQNSLSGFSTYNEHDITSV
jgi:hypothetical protein